MKYGKEFKIGLISILILIAFIWVLNFIKGYNFFNPNDYYYAIYPSSGGLQTGRPVKINGVRVGIVSDISFSSDDLNSVTVRFEVDKDYRFPVNSIAEISQGDGLMSDIEMKVILGDSHQMAQKGDTLASRTGQGLTEAIFNTIEPLKASLTATLTTMDSVLKDIHAVLNDSTRENISHSIATLSRTLEHLQVVSARTESFLSSNEKHLSSIAENTAQSMEKINAVLDTVSLRNTLANIDSIMVHMKDISSHIAHGEGSAGKLIYDEDLYKNLASATETLHALLEDVKANPKKYVNVTVFGKKERTEKQMVKDSIAAARLREKAK